MNKWLFKLQKVMNIIYLMINRLKFIYFLKFWLEKKKMNFEVFCKKISNIYSIVQRVVKNTDKIMGFSGKRFF